MLEMKHVIKMTTEQLLVAFLFSSNKEFNETQLDSFIEEAILKEDYSFSKGLLGGGWLISYLAKYNMVDVDADEILYDVDDHIYKLTINAVTSNNVKSEYLLELISYFEQRILNESKTYEFYRKFALNECLKLLVDKISCLLNEKSLLLSPLEKSKILLKFSYLVNKCLSEKDIEVLFYKNMEDLISYYQQLAIEEINNQDIETIYYLLLTSKQYANPYWINCIEELLKPIEINDKAIRELAIIANLYSLDQDNVVDFDLLNSKERYNLIFFLVSNMNSLTFNQSNYNFNFCAKSIPTL